MSTLLDNINVFGIRHLSPAGAYHLIKFLEEIRPTIVLVEGPEDANSRIKYMVRQGTKPPIAVLAYTSELPIRTILYPFADYSPEYQALLWAHKNGVPAEFIDLPSAVMLAISDLKYNKKIEENDNASDGNASSVYELWARLAGEDSYDSYWERSFEHNLNKDTYRLSIVEYSRSIRELSEEGEKLKDTYEYARNLVREAYMRYNIEKAIEKGHKSEKIVVVTGAYHASRLCGKYAPMTEKEFKGLPRRDTNLTLMPYSYYKLSSQSGYGAGNNAPSYYGMMWECMNNNDFEKLPAYYISKVASYLREAGNHRSAAEVIEGVRLANSLAALKKGSSAVLKDLRDAAVVCLGQGELSSVSEALAKAEVGTDIGLLPEGVSQTPIQDDFMRQLKKLKLEKYRTAVAEDLELDLRENRRVKSEEAAFLDLYRSFFLHRLKILGVSFAKYVPLNQQQASFGERWVLKWTPEAEIELVESVLRGETVELAAAFELKDRLEKCTNIMEAARIIKEACEAGMTKTIEQARIVLQGLAVENGDFIQIAETVRMLSIIISYGDIRKYNAEDFMPLLKQLFLRGTLLLLDASNCDNEAAKLMITAIGDMNMAASTHYEEVDYGLWFGKLSELSEKDNKNPKLSGLAMAILLEKNMIDNEKLSKEVSRRLSPGIEADLGAGWFEGLSMRNKYALLSRIGLWQQLSEYVSSLDEGQFKRALVFLRRAFCGFEPSEKQKIAEILGEVWGINAEETSEYLNDTLSEEEQNVIENLNEFDSGDI